MYQNVDTLKTFKYSNSLGIFIAPWLCVNNAAEAALRKLQKLKKKFSDVTFELELLKSFVQSWSYLLVDFNDSPTMIRDIFLKVETNISSTIASKI